MACNDCNDTPHPYRVVQTIHERNTLPCVERVNGMIVTVVGQDLSYKQYILKGGDPCVNSNWVEYGLTVDAISELIGHFTDFSTNLPDPVTSTYLNNRFPRAVEGFRFTAVTLNTMFTKISSDTWVLTPVIPINHG